MTKLWYQLSHWSDKLGGMSTQTSSSASSGISAQSASLAGGTADPASSFLILGTAGHIDHGKTTLVKALTGTNTDRLPEEKKRGITIELGFAHLSCAPFEFGIVDVPGHQRFVRTMLAGSTGVDLVLLVVAADDSINRQTREHLDILKFLDIPAGVIALTKCDKVEPEWLDLVEQEVRELVAGSFLADAAIVRTSAATGMGLESLRDALRAAGRVAAEARAPRLQQPFRMPIDRVFSIAGHGTVVTGSVTHGHLDVGQTVQILPEWPDREIRVRQLQTHDRSVQRVVRGQRAAVNLVGVTVEDVQRGFQLVAPGQLPATDCLTAWVTASPEFPDGLRDHQEIRLHLATSVVLGKVRFLQPRTESSDAEANLPAEGANANQSVESAGGAAADTNAEPDHESAAFATDGVTEAAAQERTSPTRIKRLQPGQSILAQLLLDRPVLGAWGQRMVIRRPSPVDTLGQAVVIDPCLPRLGRPDRDDLLAVEALAHPDPVERLLAATYFTWDGRLPGPSLRLRLAIPDEAWDATLEGVTERLIELKEGTASLWFHPGRLKKLQGQVLKFLDQQHTLQPKRWFIDRQSIQNHMCYLPGAVVQYLLRQMQHSHKLRHSATGVGLPDRGPNLTKNQLKLLEQLLHQYRHAGLEPPSVDDCIAQATKNKQDVLDLLKMATESGDLVQLDSQTFLAHETLADAWQRIALELQGGQSVTVSRIRDLLGITRKLAVPLCEYWDEIRYTQRRGDERVAGPAAPPVSGQDAADDR